MNRVVIEINGVRHTLVKDKKRWFDCDQCSLAEKCRQTEVLLCNLFNDGYYHFEIQKD